MSREKALCGRDARLSHYGATNRRFVVNAGYAERRVPTPPSVLRRDTHEALRDLVRAREAAKEDQLRTRPLVTEGCATGLGSGRTASGRRPKSILSYAAFHGATEVRTDLK